MPQVSPHGLFTLTRSVSPSSSVTWSDCSDSCCLDQQPLPISAIVLPRPFSSTVPPCVRNTQTVMNFSGIIDRHKLLSIFLIKPLVKKKKKIASIVMCFYYLVNITRMHGGPLGAYKWALFEMQWWCPWKWFSTLDSSMFFFLLLKKKGCLLCCHCISWKMDDLPMLSAAHRSLYLHWAQGLHLS